VKFIPGVLLGFASYGGLDLLGFDRIDAPGLAVPNVECAPVGEVRQFGCPTDRRFDFVATFPRLREFAERCRNVGQLGLPRLLGEVPRFACSTPVSGGSKLKTNSTPNAARSADMDSMEIFINEQRADLAFMRIVLTVFLVRIIAANPATAEERLLDLRTTVMAAIGRMPADQTDQGQVRWKHLVEMRGEKFLGELEALIHQARSMTGQAGRN
jgi:hypothetical protein